MGGGLSGTDRRGAITAALLLVGLVLADLAVDAVLVPLLVAVPLVAAIACPPGTVTLFGAAAAAVAVPLGAVDDIFGDDRHVVYLLAIALASAVGVAIARGRERLASVRAAEASAYRRIALLDSASDVVVAPMEAGTRLRRLVELLVGDVADLAMVDLVSADGRLEGNVTAARDPETAALVERIRARSPIDPASQHPVALALRTGEPQLRGTLTDEELRRYATGSEHLELMRQLGYRSAVVVPLVARGEALGVLSVLRLGDPVPFEQTDLSLMTDLAGRVAMAIDNAQLFEERVAAEIRLRAILGGLAEAVTIVDRAGDLVFLNEAAATLFGYASTEEALRVGPGRVYREFELLDEDGRPFDPAMLPGQLILAGQEAAPVTLRRRHLATGEERWLTVKASAVPDSVGGPPELAVNVIEDVTQERRSRDAAAFLSEASKLLASSVEYEATLRSVAHAAVPHIADGCSVDVLRDDGTAELVALAHVDPERERLVAELRADYPWDPGAPLGPGHVARTGVAELHPGMDVALLEAVARDQRHLELLRRLEMTSALVVPMTTGERVIGTITFVTSGGSRRLTEADLELAEELGRRAGVAVEHARVHRDRSQIAATLQRSLLPPRLPVVPGLTIAARFRAAGETNEVGGDFYDMFPVGDAWIVVIGDVTGKGPDAAAITSLARYTLRTAALYEPDPVAMLRRLNEALLGDRERPQMCTAACVRIRPAPDGTAAVELVCAGHPSPYVLTGPDEIEELCRPGPLLGAFPGATWRPWHLDVSAGTAIVLYTDGVTDARGADGRFGQDRLEKLLRQLAGAEADAIAGRVDDSLREFQEGPQRDDVALLVLRVGAAGDDGRPGGGETTLVADSPGAPA